MKKRIGFMLMLSIALLLAACGTAGENAKLDSEEKAAANLALKEKSNVVNGREIIAELVQTVTETANRDKVVKEQQESGMYGEIHGDGPEELLEDLAVQAIEAPAVFGAIEKVYGSDKFRSIGVLFLENGIWIGIKEPDERLDEVLKLLQPQVDAGDILAEPIYFYRSAYTEKDLELLQEEVVEALKPMHAERGSFGISSDIPTGNIEITHDFLKEEQQEELRKQFADYTIHFEQQGRLIAEPGEPTTTYPDQAFTTTPSTEGTYIMQIAEGEMLVVDTMPQDLSANGGVDDYYEAVHYTYPGATDDLKVGQRVKVEGTGFIAMTYPGQGGAKYVEVLPEYKPENAKLSESEVVVKVIDRAKKKADGIVIIRFIQFDEQAANWKIGVKHPNVGEEGADLDYEIEIKDE